MTHSRRSKSYSKREVIFDRNTKFTMTKEEFLSNLSNKGNFIRMLGDTLGEKGCTVVYSKDDADLDIATISIRESLSRNVTLIGEDSDLLILLLYYCWEQISPFRLWYTSDKNREAKENTVYDVYRYRDILGTEITLVHSCIQWL